MNSSAPFRKCFLVSLTSLILVLAPALSPIAMATARQSGEQPSHVVSSAQLQRDLDAAAARRQTRVAALQNFLSTAKARKALKAGGMNDRVVRRAVPMLSNQELANLSARAEKAQRQFDGGALTNQQLTYIIIALATAVVIIVIFKA